jgi:hypothetical protein
MFTEIYGKNMVEWNNQNSVMKLLALTCPISGMGVK